ncbi:hypothetical protein [Paenibacillus solani]|uniref:hypothetical protein n=1 Tax=Paenibacillus solani TaxID=1705565 RepID=UPI003D28C4F5
MAQINWVSRDKGLRFSPYAYVDLKKDVHFSKDEVAGLMEDTTSYVWRTFPGSGELIEMPIDRAVEGMDWRSLRLVFEKIGQDHALVGIAHDQWTP